MLSHLTIFLRLFVILFGELAPLEKKSCQTFSFIPLDNYNHFSKWKNAIDSSCVLLFLFCLFIYGLSKYDKIVLGNTNTNNSFQLIQSTCYSLHIDFRIFCWIYLADMLSLSRNEIITCEICGTQTTNPNLARHKKRCWVGTLTCSHCTNFQQNPELKWLITLPKNTLLWLLGLFIEAKHVTKTNLIGWLALSNINRTWSTEFFRNWKCWCYITNGGCWKKQTGIRTTSVQTFISGQWDGERETKSLQLCYGYSRPKISVWKIRCYVWQSQMCS